MAGHSAGYSKGTSGVAEVIIGDTCYEDNDEIGWMRRESRWSVTYSTGEEKSTKPPRICLNDEEKLGEAQWNAPAGEQWFEIDLGVKKFSIDVLYDSQSQQLISFNTDELVERCICILTALCMQLEYVLSILEYNTVKGKGSPSILSFETPHKHGRKKGKWKEIIGWEV